MVNSFFGLSLITGARIVATIEILSSVPIIISCLIALVYPPIFDPMIERERVSVQEAVTPPPHETLRYYFVLVLTRHPKTFMAFLTVIMLFNIVECITAVRLWHGAQNGSHVYIRPWIYTNGIAKLLLIAILYTGVRISLAFLILLIPLPLRLYSGMAVGTLFDIYEDNAFIASAGLPKL